MAYKFEDKFVHFRWDDSLKGKNVFYADSIDPLEDDIADGEDYRLPVRASNDRSHPFHVEGSEEEIASNWKFVYYDPNYECKKSYDEGKTIQISGDGEIWVDWEDDRDPDWDSAFQFRIKSESTYCVIAGVSSRLVAIKKSSVKKGVHVFYESDSLEDCINWIAERRKIENVMVAYAEGKEVEFLNMGDVWCPASTPVWRIDTMYRIKPKGYRAFKNTDELKKKWEELCPTNIHRPSLCEPLIWVKCKSNDITGVISRFAGNIVSVSYTPFDLKELFEKFTFLDGTPCGIRE